MTVEHVDLRENTLQRLDRDERYKKLLLSVDEETRKRIDNIVRQFICDFADGFSKLTEPDVKQKLLELMKHDKR